jgi:tetratricopeptide (TPR) repeat protein
MSPAEAVFFAALAKADPAERAAYLDAACGGDAELRRRVDRLLAAHPHVGGFLGQPAAEPGGTAVFHPLPEATPPPPEGAARPGAVLAGRYKLLEPIGQGGMGAVWMAQQHEPVKRLVAVKLIKAGLDSAPVLARFEAERQALALMDHPHIAKVLDGGAAPDGRPFFVMELVKGVPITRFCDEHRLTPRQRLELFIPVCQAIQHAHQKGVIHRDIKPSNVLVALYDDRPVPKVIDFGVAKATGAQLTEQTLHTGFGAVVGTVEYMSPEQASFNQLNVDTRSDVYALGVLLYELLTGGPPFSRKELERAGVLEMLRIIREQEPSRPSTKLSTAEGLPTLAANRSTEPARLTRLVRGELDWIVMKCLEKDRGRRYETANGLALDLQRYLADEPVQACPPSAWYRFRKFTRRNRAPVVAAALVLLSLVVGMIGTTWGLIQAEQERRGEERQRRAAEANAERATQAQKRAQQGFAKAREAVEQYLKAVTDDPDLKHKHDLHRLRKKLLNAAVAFYQWFTEQKPDEAAWEAERGRAYWRLAEVRGELGESEAAQKDYERMLTIFAWLTAEFPATPEYSRDHAAGHNNLGNLLKDLGQWSAAERAFRRALEIQEKLVADFPAVPGYRVDLANSHHNLGYLLSDRGERAAGERAYRQALRIREKLVAEFPATPEYRDDLASVHNNLGNLLRRWGQLPAAERALRRAVGIRARLVADFPAVPRYRRQLADSSLNLGFVVRHRGQPEAAERACLRGLDLYRKLAADFPSVPQYRVGLASGHNDLGLLLTHLGEWSAAEQAFRRALEHREVLAAEFPAVPSHRLNLAGTYVNLGTVLRAQGETEASLPRFAKAISLLEALVKQEPRGVEGRRFLRNAHSSRAEALAQLARHADAVADWDRALALNATPEDEVRYRHGRAMSLARAGEHARAVAEAAFLAELKGHTGQTLYDLACVCALAAADAQGDARLREQYAARAVALLRQAIAAGYTDAAGMKKDRDLDALRDRADFRAVLAETRANNKGPK